MNLVDTLEPGHIIHCGRCANEDFAYTTDEHEAAAYFASIGWTREKVRGDPLHRNYCPDCNQELA